MSKRERIEALEARVAALEASNSPGGLGAPTDNTPGGLCGQIGPSGHHCWRDAGHDSPHESGNGMSRGFEQWADPAPVPQWRALVDAARHFLTGEEPLVAVLRSLACCVADDSKVTDANLASILVAVCEGQVGDGWKADPGRVPHGHWGIAWLLAPLSHEPPDWVVVADRAAAWLRDLTDGAS